MPKRNQRTLLGALRAARPSPHAYRVGVGVSPTHFFNALVPLY